MRLKGYPKTSASGIHIYIPLKKGYSYAQVREAAKIIAKLVCAQLPTLATIERTVRKQNGKGLCRLSAEWGREDHCFRLQCPAGSCRLRFYAFVMGRDRNREIMPAMFTIESVRQRLEERDDIFLLYWKKSIR